jgi:serine/threonine protein kinase
MFCISCGTQLSDRARFCANCGTRVDDLDTNATILGDEALLDSNLETIAPEPQPTVRRASPQPVRTPVRPRSAPSSNPILTSTDAIGGGRFTPGAIIGERYRIVALLGRGGMGEVYRAEDLRLTQVVAIKFLPEALSRDASALARFHSEVRVARQVSHPNVCRVFDIGDAEGIPFLTMEYVDGEDIASLIRRIGRLPQDKATEISRQICAGLAAAHERGVVHRDLKPANVMLDGSGKVRVTDFGLAGIAATIQGAEIRAGTPAYMAPEQLSGKEVTTKSDIYSLGLVMYEILTGKRAYDAATLPQLIKAREEAALTSPSTLVRDLDPLIERVILRCLEKDPAKRPSTALQVSAALPGGDPLAAALAAGETPSPEMVAAAGETEGLNPRIGLLCLVGVCLLLAALLGIAKRSKMISYISFGPGPEVLKAKANDMIRSFGYTDSPADTAQGFELMRDYLQHISESVKTPRRWEVLKQDEPPALMFWYRENPRLLISFSPVDNLVYGRVQPDEPPMTASGGRSIELSPQGNMLVFRATPPQVDEPPTEPPSAPDWSKLFEAAGLDQRQFRAVPPRWYPLAWGDSRAAWEGTWPNHPGIPLRVEAAGYRGRPIFFTTISPWDKPTRMEPPTRSRQNSIGQWFSFGILGTILGLGIWMASRSVRAGRGDLKGATRLAVFVALVGIVNWGLLAHHVSSQLELVLFILAVSVSLFFGLLTWLLYVALEPYVRRYWPDTLISWSRFLAGKFKDPVVARDVLLGTLFGLSSAALEQLQPFVEAWLGKAPQRPLGLTTAYTLEGLKGSIATVLHQASASFSDALVVFLFFFVLRLVFRRNWLAALVMSLLFCIPSLGAQNPLIDMLFTAPFFWVYLYILYRFGLVALTVLYFVDQLADNMPLATPLSAWYTEGGLVAMITILAVAFYGFYVSRAGKPVFETGALDL